MIIQKLRNGVSVRCGLEYIGYRWYFMISTIITLNNLGVAAASTINTRCLGLGRRLRKRLVHMCGGVVGSTVP